MIHLSLTDPRPPSNRQARCGESSCIAPETAVGCPITRGATGHVRITIVKLQGSIRDIREAWVSLFLTGKKKTHLSRHIGNYKTPGPVMEESCVPTRRVLQAVSDPSHEGEGRFTQPSHRINADGEECDLMLLACIAVVVNLLLVHIHKELLHRRAQRCCPIAASPVIFQDACHLSNRMLTLICRCFWSK